MHTTKLRGARTHNLKSLDLDIEPGTYLAVVGPSGAGKSSLAFRTLYAEGQRRYVESFSAYARQFLERLSRPDMKGLDPVPVGIAVDRQAPVRTSRSTVGTMTEIADYIKTLWAAGAYLVCPKCGEEVERSTPTHIAKDVVRELKDERIVITYPLPVNGAESFLELRETLLAEGYGRIWQQGKATELETCRPSDIDGAKVLDVVADRTIARARDQQRIAETLEAAMARAHGKASVWSADGKARPYSNALECTACGSSFQQASPAMFSSNNPIGACETCRGFGRTIEVDIDKVIPDHSLSLESGALRAWQGKAAKWERKQLFKHAKAAGIPTDKPLSKWSKKQWQWLIEGDELGYPKGWWGVKSWFRWLESRAYKMHVRVFLSRYRKYVKCHACDGTRLKPAALNWKIDGMTLPEFYASPIRQACDFVEAQLSELDHEPGARILAEEAHSRLKALNEIGLGYLSLDRPSRTLSGGEAQRIALTSALGARLNGAMFVLDEPTVGLHPRDTQRLEALVRDLARGDNIALVVEHDPTMILGADRVVELGPGAGDRGGRIVFDGSPEQLRKHQSATGAALSTQPPIQKRRRPTRSWLQLKGAKGNNLNKVDVRFPIGAWTALTGVSGSGKSSLVVQTLYPALIKHLSLSYEGIALPYTDLEVDGVIAALRMVDQAPLGRTSRGNTATYLKVWELFRKRFCTQKLAKERGYKPGMFSFNVRGGRCEACAGQGSETVEMQFLADVTFSCPECQGRRFSGPVLDVRVEGLNIAEVLELTAEAAIEHFASNAKIVKGLQPLLDVGLGYLRLGQPLNMLSGGEAQRLKLAQALAGDLGGTLLILDEPTAGLHVQDVAPLLELFDRLVDAGASLITISHNMQLAAHADYVIDLGPGAGEEGGKVVAAGTPEEVAKRKKSLTAPFLKVALAGEETKSSGSRTSSLRSQDQGQGIVIEGAREHNLKGVSVTLPREKLIAITGPSGSGKSTLTFDILFAEGQRRYLETLSPYARQYMPQLPRPEVDRVAGVPPSVSLEQRTTRAGANSTVATVTEVAHYLRLLWAKAGLLHCVDCEVPIAARSVREIEADIKKRFKNSKFKLLAPLIRSRKGLHKDVLAKAKKAGFQEVRIDGEWQVLKAGMQLDRYREHDIELVVWEGKATSSAFVTALERTLELGKGSLEAYGKGDPLLLSTKRACPSCGKGYPELDPRFFSFNTKQGQCEKCEGRGEVVTKKWRGRRRRRDVSSAPCEACGQTRLSKLARSVSLDDTRIDEILALSVNRCAERLRTLVLDERNTKIAKAPLREALRRLAFLDQVGLGYLELDRAAKSLSGGEMQRVRLGAQLGAGMTGALYVLDEPTIGLHPRDTERLLKALRSLVQAGNSVAVVEHDADTIRAAEHVIDMGPGGGHRGGEIIGQGPLKEMKHSLTAKALQRAPKLPVRRRSVDHVVRLKGAAQHNLKQIDVDFPLGCLTVVSGVSGSGKSTLVRDVFYRAVREALELVNEDAPGSYKSIEGTRALQRAVEIDQSPIGRTPRSIPATYIGIWDPIRKLLAGTPEARARGYQPKRFSFNVDDGRCQACKGQGAIQMEMAFLPDVLSPCDSCRGARFTVETLEVRWKGYNVAELLDLEVSRAVQVFENIPSVHKPLQLLEELGLGYLKLGQASNTLSGGEAQRIKLVAELALGNTQRKSLYVMDEPTTGLHRDDVEKLISVLQKLVERGDSLVVIEHHPDVMLAADHLIDLGPEGGVHGGKIVACGTPEELAKHPSSHTGKVLKQELARERKSEPKKKPVQTKVQARVR